MHPPADAGNVCYLGMAPFICAADGGGGGWMLFPSRSAPHPAAESKAPRCLLAGAGVGVLTGFLGVGGGFLLMRALAKFARLPLRVATGISLAVIACNSAAGFVAYLDEAPTP